MNLSLNPWLKPLVILLVVLVILPFLSPVGTIRAGERGIRLRFGALTSQVLGEGLYFRIPFVEEVKKMDVKIQKEEVVATAASKDLQTVSSKVALNFRPDPQKVGILYQSVGMDYKDRLISPSLQEAVKASTARFTAEELITKREVVRDMIKKILTEKLTTKGIILDEFNIVDFQFSRAFNDAIENKVTAEQQALAAKNKLEQVKFEAEQRIAEAKGKAEAITVESAALQNKPQVLELRAIEKWDGRLPQVTGENTPFININPR